jgi:hypothetical protein
MTLIGCAWAWIADHATVLSAVVSAIAAVAIAFFTVKLTHATTKQARLTRKAITLARDEFNATHRPKIVCLFFESYTGAGGDPDGVEITYVNVGPAPAVMIEIGRVIIATENLRVGAITDIASLNRKVLASGVKDTAGIGNLIVDIARLNAKDRALGAGMPIYCIGHIAYEDMAGLRRETGFCRLFAPGTDSWLSVKDSEYEYSY